MESYIIDECYRLYFIVINIGFQYEITIFVNQVGEK